PVSCPRSPVSCFCFWSERGHPGRVLLLADVPRAARPEVLLVGKGGRAGAGRSARGARAGRVPEAGGEASGTRDTEAAASVSDDRRARPQPGGGVRSADR